MVKNSFIGKVAKRGAGRIHVELPSNDFVAGDVVKIIKIS